MSMSTSQMFYQNKLIKSGVSVKDTLFEHNRIRGGKDEESRN